MEKDRLSRKLAVILHADVVGSTTLVQQDEVLAHERIQSTFQRFSETIKAYGGITRELRGDALVAEFERASDAVIAAIAFQAQNEEFDADLSDEIKPTLRIGISLGEVVIADNTITGAGVVLAQRLEQLAEPGGVVVQGSVSETVPKRMPFEFENLGEQSLKGFDQPVRAYSAILQPGTELPLPEIKNAYKHDQETTSSASAYHTPIDTSEKPSIAVLPFTNMSGDPEQEFFADGISEDIITALSKIRSFLVIARNSTFTYKGKPVDIKTVASELNVRYVLEGSVRKAGNRVRITAQLIEASSGHHIWAERYDRVLSNIFDLQDEMTQTIAGTIEPELSAKERDSAVRKPPDNLDTWEIYQRAMWYFYSYKKENNLIAIDLLQKAIKADPNFALAYAYLSYSHYAPVIMGWTDDPEAFLSIGMVNAKKALALDPRESLAYIALGRIHMLQGNHDDSIAAQEKAIELNPNAFLAYHGLGMVLVFSGRMEEGLDVSIKGETFSPRNPGLFSSIAVRALACILLKRYDEAVAYSERAQQFPVTAGYWPHATKASALAQLGNIDDAQATLQLALGEKPDLSITYLQKTLPTKFEGGLNTYLNGLRKAGLPE